MVNKNVTCKSYSVIFEDCWECGKITPFVDTLLCLYCGSDSPFGCYYDFDISDEEIREYIENHTISVGVIDDLDENIIEFLNKL